MLNDDDDDDDMKLAPTSSVERLSLADSLADVGSLSLVGLEFHFSS